MPIQISFYTNTNTANYQCVCDRCGRYGIESISRPTALEGWAELPLERGSSESGMEVWCASCITPPQPAPLDSYMTALEARRLLNRIPLQVSRRLFSLEPIQPMSRPSGGIFALECNNYGGSQSVPQTEDELDKPVVLSVWERLVAEE